MDYIWENIQSSPHSDRVIFLKNQAYQYAAKKSFKAAFKEKWHVDIPDFDIEVKRLPSLAYKPKFKTRLRNANADTWHAFIQIFDKGRSLEYATGAYNMRYEILFRLINGQDLSIITNRVVFLNIVQWAPLPGQIVLTRLPGDPAQFMSLIDSIANFTIDTTAAYNKEFEIGLAYVYDETEINLTPKHRVSKFPVATLRVDVDEVGKHKNVGSNSLGGALTLLTGIRTDKVKSVKYMATHSFFDVDDTIKVTMKYIDEQSAERERVNHDDGYKSLEKSEYNSARILDKDSRNYITKGADTLGWYMVSFERSAKVWKQMWNGIDTATINILPFEWNNGFTREMRLTGKLNDQDFSMETIENGANQKFVLNGEYIAKVNGRNSFNASLFHDLDQETVNVIAVLCKISDYYFRYE